MNVESLHQELPTPQTSFSSALKSSTRRKQRKICFFQTSDNRQQKFPHKPYKYHLPSSDPRTRTRHHSLQNPYRHHFQFPHRKREWDFMTSKKRVLVVGGTGYLGQHVLQGFSQIEGKGITSTSPFDLAFTHHSNPPPQALLDAHLLPFQVDLKTGHGFQAISQTFGRPDVVINCAALSVPRACEMDPAAAMSVNVPSSLVNWLSSFEESSSLLIHLSTDQVYEGVKSFYKEDDETAPVNVYGKSKVAAEQFISEKCSNFAILRSSIIFGPQTISPVPKSLPIQWIDGVLSKGKTSEFFHDEFRCPVYVKDVVAVILALSKRWIYESKQTKVLLNVGGPDRVSRLQMAEIVANVRGYNPSLIKSVSASSVDRGVMSPADISMDITKLVRTLGIAPTSFRDGVRLTLETEAKSS